MSRWTLSKFRASLGPLQQAQIVASTAVVVALMTIVAVRYLSVGPETLTTRPKFDWILLMSVLTTGLFGFFIVIFTLKYNKLLDAQRQELMALNTISEAVNRAIEINYLLQNVLQEISRVLELDYGWIYRTIDNHLILSAQRGAEELQAPIIPNGAEVASGEYSWVREPRRQKIPKKRA